MGKGTQIMKQAQNKMIVSGTPGQFDFALERDPETVYSLPLIQDLPAKQVRSLSKAQSDVDIIFDLLDKLAPGLTDTATQRDISLIMEAWSEASNADLGE